MFERFVLRNEKNEITCTLDSQEFHKHCPASLLYLHLSATSALISSYYEDSERYREAYRVLCYNDPDHSACACEHDILLIRLDAPRKHASTRIQYKASVDFINYSYTVMPPATRRMHMFTDYAPEATWFVSLMHLTHTEIPSEKVSPSECSCTVFRCCSHQIYGGKNLRVCMEGRTGQTGKGDWVTALFSERKQSIFFTCIHTARICKYFHAGLSVGVI